VANIGINIDSLYGTLNQEQKICNKWELNVWKRKKKTTGLMYLIQAICKMQFLHISTSDYPAIHSVLGIPVDILVGKLALKYTFIIKSRTELQVLLQVPTFRRLCISIK
jgi:hypothetical protein